MEGPAQCAGRMDLAAAGAAADADFVARAANNMMRAIETQMRLVEDLLDYSRGSRGRLSIHPVRLLIAAPIEASLEARSRRRPHKRTST